jgi:hypothetical protein
VNQSEHFGIPHYALAQLACLLNPLSPEFPVNVRVFMSDQPQGDQRVGAVERPAINSTLLVFDCNNAARASLALHHIASVDPQMACL